MKVKPTPIYTVPYNTYMVSFKTQNKYNPVTRNIEVMAIDEASARNIVSNLFDSFKLGKDKITNIPIRVPSEKHIAITKVKQIKKKEKKTA